MSGPVERFPYIQRDPQHPDIRSPFIPVSLWNGAQSLSSYALVDSGSTINVLPQRFGAQLGLDWGQQTVFIPLTGSLSGMEARAIRLACQVGHLPRVVLAFAWTVADASPIIFGQTNFFQEFDVCFFRSQLAFEVRPKRPFQDAS